MITPRLKIAFLVGKFPAISETFILNQITGLIDAGHHVDIYSKNRSSDAIMHTDVESYGLLERTRYLTMPRSPIKRYWQGLGIMAEMLRSGRREILRALDVRTYGRRAASFGLLYRLYPLLEHGPYDVLHCHFGPVGLMGMHIKDLGVPGKFIVTFHGHDISQYLKSEGNNVYQRLFREADLLLPISDYWKERLLDIGADPTRVRVHRMGINLDDFTLKERRHRAGEEIRLMTVGRLVEKKGIAYALQAMANVLRRHPDWRIRYDIVGSGDQESSLRAMIAAQGLEHCATLVGSITSEEVHRRMLDSDIFLLPSATDDNGDQEGVPVSLMEAMASGMPVLSTLHTGIPELVQDGRSGFLVPEKDVAALTDRLEQLIYYPDRWAEMGRAGRRMVETNHNIHTLNRELVEIYHRLLNGAIHPPIEPVANPSSSRGTCLS